MGTYSIRYLSSSEYDKWDQFVLTSEHGTIFHRSAWIESIQKVTPGLSFSIIGAFNQNEILGGAIVYWKKLPGSLKYIVQPYSSSFYGLIIKERDSEFASKQESYRKLLLDELLSFIESEFQSISFGLPISFTDIRVFNWRKYSSAVFYTYKEDISDPELLFDRFLPALKRQIRKAEKQDYSIERSKDKEHLAEVYGLLKKSYQRQKHAFHFSFEQFKSVLHSPDLSDNFAVFLIKKEQTPVAVLVLLLDRETSYYWLAGGDHAYFNTGLNQLLLWEAINALSKEGIKSLDLVGANTISIASYKSNFNFSLKPYYLVKKSTHILTKISDIRKYLKRGRIF